VAGLGPGTGLWGFSTAVPGHKVVQSQEHRVAFNTTLKKKWHKRLSDNPAWFPVVGCAGWNFNF
jgi:hypothetical protein